MAYKVTDKSKKQNKKIIINEERKNKINKVMVRLQ